jgi:hypothetical protein
MTLLDNFNLLLNSCTSAYSQARIGVKVKELAKGILNCYGRHTVTGMLTACGKQFVDWSATYRMFSQNRVNVDEMFRTIVNNVVDCQSDHPYIVAHMDDTLIRKTGKKIPGASWKRDPLGPPFQTNFVWGQRYIGVSLALAPAVTNCQSRAIPVDFFHSPTPVKPKKNATDTDIKHFREAQKKQKLSVQGAHRIAELREKLNDSSAKEKQLIISVDGSYTNDAVLKKLPERTTLVGRIRKDAKLFTLPTQTENKGRKKVYGDQLPTPEQIRQDEKIEWISVTSWAAGKSHQFNVKIIKDVKWKSAGQKSTLQVVVIRPLGYRLNGKSRMLYRQPAYLICTDNNLPIENLLQTYLWRWEIEVNLRDEKTILGCGKAQVRNENSVINLPAFTTAIYSMIHLAAYNSNLTREKNVLPKAKWDSVPKQSRLSTTEIINLYRCELWAKQNDKDFNDFVSKQHESQSRRNEKNSMNTAMFYVRK